MLADHPIKVSFTPVDHADDPDVEFLVSGIGAGAAGGEDGECGLLNETAAGDCVAYYDPAKLPVWPSETSPG